MRRMPSSRVLGTVLTAALLAAGVPAPAARTAYASDGPCPGVDANALPISYEQAQSIAVAQVPGAVREIKLECEHGRTLYKVEIQPQAGGRQMELEIDAASGAVLKVEAD